MNWQCPNGYGVGLAHEFHVIAEERSIPLMYCRRCGEIRRVEMPPIQRITVSQSTSPAYPIINTSGSAT